MSAAPSRLRRSRLTPEWNSHSSYAAICSVMVPQMPQMQQIAYQASPYIIFGYPQFLEATTPPSGRGT